MNKKINLGAGNDCLKGYINHDLIKHSDKIDIIVDLNLDNWQEVILKKYPNKFEEVRAWDLIEHLDNPINFMDNCWHLLKDDGILTMKACGWKNPNYYVDITHKHGYDIRSFDYFDPTTELGQRYGYYTSYKWEILSLNYDRHFNVLVKMRRIK